MSRLPCGECHLLPGELCDICGTRAAAIERAANDFKAIRRRLKEIFREPAGEAPTAQPEKADAPIDTAAQAIMNPPDDERVWDPYSARFGDSA